MIYQIGLILVILVGFNSTNSTEILEYVENNIIHDLDNIYCQPNAFGNESGIRDLLDRDC